MSFDAGSIVARMKLDRSQFTAGLKSGVQDAQKFDRTMGSLFRSGFMATGIIYATKRMYEFTATSARLADMSDAFERMAGSADMANRILAQSRSVSRSLSERDLKAAANQLELLGIGMEKLPRFVEIARSAAIGLNQDVGFMLQSLSTGTARQSRLWLDNLGIIISVEQANKEYARTLGKTADELNDTEQRAAFLNAVLTHGQDIIKKVGAESETAGEKIQSLGAFAQDSGDKVSTFLVPAWTKWVDAMTKLKDLGMPTGPWDMGPLIAKGVAYMDALQRSLHARFPGIFGAGPPLVTSMTTGGKGSPFAGMNIGGGLAALAGNMPQSFGPTPGANGPTMRGTGNTFTGLDWREVTDPGLTMGADQWTQTFNVIGSGLSSLGDAFGSFFEMMITDSKNAGRAFFSGLMAGFSGIATNLGDLYIQAGIGMMGLMQLSPLLSIAAGLALKSIGGIMRGIAFNNAPISAGPARSLRNPLGNGDGAGGAFTLVVNGDFVGDRVWVQRLASMIRQNERNFGSPKVVFNS